MLPHDVSYFPENLQNLTQISSATGKNRSHHGVIKFLAMLLFGALPLCATELMPWYGRNLEFEARATYLFQNFHSINHRSYHSNDSFLALSLSVPFAQWSGEVEMIFADTRHRDFGLDNVRFTGRYQWLDDIIGDPVTLTTGITVIQAFQQSLQDIGSFHHGKIEAEAHLSVGKEFGTDEFWIDRIWGVFGLGTADVGYPWLRGEAAWERQFCNLHQFRAFVNSLWGLGHKKVHIHHFKGYGPIRHQSIDLGARYSYYLECTGATLSLEYARRVYSKNFPKNANLVMLRLFYPFGI